MKIILFVCTLVGLFSSTFTTVLSGQVSSNISLVERLANDFLKKTKLPGISIAVSRKGEVIYAKGFGYADLKSKTKMIPSTQLRTASVAKVITATALGRLVSEGKLDLDAPIKTYIPYINAKYAHLSSRQLAGHTAGLAHRPKGNSYKKKQYDSTRTTVELMDSPLLFEPDTEYKYSTHAFNLLAAVIEEVSGMPYSEYLKKEIFAPLGMTQTFPENIKLLTTQDATLYYMNKGKLREESLTNASYKLAGAGFRSTPTDLVKMTHAYYNKLIHPNIVTEMFKSHQLKNGEKTNVGIAWRSSFDAFGNALVEHAGSWRGTRTVVVYYPQEQLSIALMINADCQIFIEEMAHILAQLFRENQETSHVPGDLEEILEVSYHSGKEKGQYKGKMLWKGGKGILNVEMKGFLGTNPVQYLGFGNHYAVITNYGLLYLNYVPSIKGDLYLYANRNAVVPTKKTALASFNCLPATLKK